MIKLYWENVLGLEDKIWGGFYTNVTFRLQIPNYFASKMTKHFTTKMTKLLNLSKQELLPSTSMFQTSMTNVFILVINII